MRRTGQTLFAVLKSFTPRTIQTSAWFVGLSANWSGIQYSTITEAALANPVAYRAIQIIADSVGDIQIHLHERDGEDVKEKDDHEFLEWFRKPDGVQSTRQFMRALTIYDICAGNNYIWLRGSGPFFNDSGEPTGRKPQTIRLLQPDKITRVVRDDVTDEITFYFWTNRRGAQIRIPADEILHVKNFNPLDTENGYAPLNAAWNALQLMDSANDWNKSVYDAKGRQPGMVEFEGPQPMETDALARTQQLMNERYANQSRLSLPMLWNKWMKFTPTAQTQKDADFIGAMLQYMREIAIALGVDPSLLGDAANKTYSNLETALRSLFILTAIPRLNFFLDELSCRLLPMWDDNPNLMLGFDRNQIEALQEDQTALFERMSKAVGRPWMSPDDARQAVNLEESGDDAIPIPLNLIPIGPPPDEDSAVLNAFRRELANATGNGHA